MSIRRKEKLFTTSLQKIEEHNLKSQKIKDILAVPINKKQAKNECIKQLMNQKKNLTRSNADELCECLYSKNGELTVEELEKLTQNREETPGSFCIEKYDEITSGHKSNKSSKKSHKSKKSSNKYHKSNKLQKMKK